MRIIQAGDDFSIVYKGRALFSRVNPRAQTQKILSTLFPLEERTLYLCASPLAGFNLEDFVRSLPARSALLCVEVEKELFEWTRERDFVKNLSSEAQKSVQSERRFAFSGTKDASELCRIVRETFGSCVFRRVKLINFSGGAALHKEVYRLFEETLRREMRLEWGNALTLTVLGRLYMRNTVKNIALLAERRGLDTLDFGESDIFVFGAGPSLDSFLDFAGRKRRGNARLPVIAVDTALMPLLERGISPDLVVVLEAQHWNLGDFIGAEGARQYGAYPAAAAFDLSALPQSTRVLSLPPFIFMTEWTALRIFSRLRTAALLPPVLPPLGSVGLSAVLIALKLTRGNVIISGLDFSFTQSNYHCRGSPSHLALLRGASRFTPPYNDAALFREGSFWATSKIKSPVRSDISLEHYRTLFESNFSSNPLYKTRLFDIEGEGLPLGIKTLSLSEAAGLFSGGGAARGCRNAPRGGTAGEGAMRRGRLIAFIKNEINLLSELSGALKGERSITRERLDFLLGELDYLWAHFPDCASRVSAPASGGISFLKRVGTEAYAFLDLWRRALT